MFDNKAIWADVVGYEGLYCISTDGRVYSIKSDKVLYQKPNDYGYMRISLYKEGKRFEAKVHRLVAQAFLPNPDNLSYVNHINADRTDNRLENLEWISPSDNLAHAVKLGNRDFERKPPITKEIVLEIRNRYVFKCPVNGKQALAKEYDIHPEKIRKIVNRITYKDI